MDDYPFHSEHDGYLLFLGRMSPDKGAHNAVEIARATGLPLKLAGKIHDPEEKAHFDAAVAPHLDGQIEYLGEVSHDEKVELLQRAMVTLFPIQWAEPFGLVMVESMACGTPVAAIGLGAVPEVVVDGRSGIVESHVAGLIERLDEAIALDRADVARAARERFSAERMVSDYEAAYELLLSRGSSSAAR